MKAEKLNTNTNNAHIPWEYTIFNHRLIKQSKPNMYVYIIIVIMSKTVKPLIILVIYTKTLPHTHIYTNAIFIKRD